MGKTLLKAWSAVSGASTHKTHNEHKTETSMSSAEFDSAIPEFETIKTYALDNRATGIGRRSYYCLILFVEEIH